MHKYPSDIDRSQFAIITLILESSCKTTSTRNVDLYDVLQNFIYFKKWLSMEVDTKGLPHAICFTTADATHRNGAIDILKKYNDHFI